MTSNQIIHKSILELSTITKAGICVTDTEGTVIVSTIGDDAVSLQEIRAFIDSSADAQVVVGRHFFKVDDESGTVYVVIVNGSGENSSVIGRIAVSQIMNIMEAHKERLDLNNFFQNLILDNLLLVDIYNRAKKLRVNISERRLVYLIEVVGQKDITVMETLRGLFSQQQGDFVTAVDEKNIILIKSLEKDDDAEATGEIAKMIVDMMNAEAMVKVRVTYGTVVEDLKEVSKSYKEALMAMDVGKIFYNEKTVVPYSTLGIGRLIYQLPIPLCQLFMKEIFGENIPDDLDEETLTTINKFFENNLNVSETSRQLYVHRNTLVYRIEKLQKSTGLDIRVFDDALTLKIALMVVSYMKYLEKKQQ